MASFICCHLGICVLAVLGESRESAEMENALHPCFCARDGKWLTWVKPPMDCSRMEA